jgi:CheY-like chemotaxis protein
MSLSILVVDDEADVADLFRQSFRREVRAGTYAMHFADSADAALKRLRAGIMPPLIVILADINMPGMDGFGLLSEIKRQWPELPVMMVTAYGDEERRLRAHQLGALDFLTKPVDFHHLKAQLQELTTPAG